MLDFDCDGVYQHQCETKCEKGCVCGCPYFEVGTEAANLDAAIAQKAGSVLQSHFRYFESAVFEAHAQGVRALPPGNLFLRAKNRHGYYLLS